MKKSCSQNKARRFANGGVPDPFASMSMLDMAQYTNDPTALNIAATRDFAERDASTQGIRGPKTGYQFYSGDPALKQNTRPGSLISAVKPDPNAPFAVFADGGKIDPEELMRRMASKYGTSPSAPTQTAPVQKPDPVQQPKAQPQGIASGISNIFANRTKNIDAAVERAERGYADGGLISNAAEYWANDNAQFEKTNPGFIARVARSVNPMTGFGSAMGAMHTSAGNGDIPGMAMAGITAIPAFGVLRSVPAAGAAKASLSPSIGNSAAALTGGAVVNAAADEYQSKNNKGYRNGGKIQGPGTPTSDDIDAEVVETKEPIKVSTGERIVSHAQGQLLERVAKGIGYKSLDDLLEAGTGKPVGPTIKGGKVAAEDGGVVNRAWYAGTDSRDERSGLEMERERRASAPSSVLANDPVKSALVYGVVGQGQKQQPAQVADYGNEGRSVPKPITNESQRAVSVPGASIVQAATQPIDNMRQPDLTTKDVLPGGYLDRGAGIVAQRGGNGRLNVTNVGTEGLTDPAKKIVDGSESALIDQKNSTYNPAAQLQRMQALRMTSDATDSTITDPAVRENAIKSLSLIQAAQAGEQARQTNQVDMQGKRLANQQAQVMADLQGKAIAGDPDALKTLNALNGKGLDNEFKIGNIEQTNPDGSKSSVPVRITRNGAEVVDGKQQKPVTSKDEVAKAIATGRITKEQAAKRLADAGLNPKDYGL